MKITPHPQIFESYRMDRKLKFKTKVYSTILYTLILSLVFVLLELTVNAQSMGVNNPSPHNKSLLDLTSSDKGLLIPRMTQAQRLAMFSSADASAKGMLVYQTDASEGFYFYDGAVWQTVNSNAGWGVTGNAGTSASTNFIGTSDNNDVVFKTNNVERMRTLANGNVGIGTSTPLQKMDVAGNMNFANDTNNIRVNNQRVFSVKGTSNLFAGELSGTNNTGTSNTFIGDSAGHYNTSGYANTGVGMNALKNNTTGTWNVAVGRLALDANTTGFSNSAVGIGALIYNTTGYRNTAMGGGGLQNNTTGFENTSVGYYASRDNKTASYNVSVGTYALLQDSTGDNNVAVGHAAGFNVTSGSKNVLIGKNAGYYSTTGYNNVFIGYEAGKSNTTAGFNTFIGYESGKANTTGFYNSYLGFQTGLSNTTGEYNSFFGLQAGMYNTTGYENSFYGAYSGVNTTTGFRNVMFGNATGSSNTTGFYNAFAGWGAGNGNTTGQQNAYFGGASGYLTTTGSFNTAIGTNALKNNVTGGYNVMVGNYAGFNTTATNNTFVGNNAGANNTSGTNNTSLGYNAQVGATLSNATAIGYNSSVTTNNSLVLGGTGAGAVNVGIGLTNPEFPLSFAGITGDKISFWGGTGNHYGIGIQASLLQIHSANSNDDIAFGYGSSAALTERMRIKGTGNVGIGTSTPQTRLQVVNNDSAWQTTSIKNSHSSGWSGIWFQSAAGAFAGHYGYGNASAPRWANQVFAGSIANIPFILTTNDIERMRIDANGNIGVDTIAPQARMHLKSNGSVGWPQLLVEERDSTDFSRISFMNKGFSKYWTIAANLAAVDSNSRFNIYNSVSGNAFTVTGNNRIGINNTNPMASISTDNTLGQKISFWQSGTNCYGIGLQGYMLQIHTASVSDDVTFGYGSSAAFTETMRIKGNGDVGIGTTTPTATLEVNGYTKLGSTAPAIKMKKFTGNTATTSNSSVTITHGLTQSKIIGVQVLVSSTSNTMYPPGATSSSGGNYTYAVTSSSILIINEATNSQFILNRPYTVLVTYEE